MEVLIVLLQTRYVFLPFKLINLSSILLWYKIRFISDVVIRNCTAISRLETLLQSFQDA